jgi:hypothetical protein
MQHSTHAHTHLTRLARAGTLGTHVVLTTRNVAVQQCSATSLPGHPCTRRPPQPAYAPHTTTTTTTHARARARPPSTRARPLLSRPRQPHTRMRTRRARTHPYKYKRRCVFEVGASPHTHTHPVTALHAPTPAATLPRHRKPSCATLRAAGLSQAPPTLPRNSAHARCGRRPTRPAPTNPYKHTHGGGGDTRAYTGTRAHHTQPHKQAPTGRQGAHTDAQRPTPRACPALPGDGRGGQGARYAPGARCLLTHTASAGAA